MCIFWLEIECKVSTRFNTFNNFFYNFLSNSVYLLGTFNFSKNVKSMFCDSYLIPWKWNINLYNLDSSWNKTWSIWKFSNSKTGFYTIFLKCPYEFNLFTILNHLLHHMSLVESYRPQCEFQDLPTVSLCDSESMPCSPWGKSNRKTGKIKQVKKIVFFLQ